jgi:hypothetical protein
MTSNWAAVVLAVVLAPIPLGSQLPPPSPPGGEHRPSVRSDRQLVTVRGCVRGGALEPSADSQNDEVLRLYPGSVFVLKGNREILGQLRQHHNGHMEEVTGVVTLPQTLHEATNVKKKKLGDKTTLTFGSREADRVEATVHTLRLDVQSFVHLDDRCVSRPDPSLSGR